MIGLLFAGYISGNNRIPRQVTGEKIIFHWLIPVLKYKQKHSVHSVCIVKLCSFVHYKIINVGECKNCLGLCRFMFMYVYLFIIVSFADCLQAFFCRKPAHRAAVILLCTFKNGSLCKLSSALYFAFVHVFLNIQ